MYLHERQKGFSSLFSSLKKPVNKTQTTGPLLLGKKSGPRLLDKNEWSTTLEQKRVVHDSWTKMSGPLFLVSR